MAILLTRNYTSGGNAFTSGQTVVLPSDTEAALVAQGYGTLVTNGATMSNVVGAPDAVATIGGVSSLIPQAGIGPQSTIPGAYFWPNIALGSAALTGYETNGVAQTAGTINYADIVVPFSQTWTGAGILNGTTVGTHNVLCVLYGANGVLLANSAVAGVVSAGASVMQNIPFTAPIILPSRRHLVRFRCSRTTPTRRH